MKTLEYKGYLYNQLNKLLLTLTGRYYNFSEKMFYDTNTKYQKDGLSITITSLKDNTKLSIVIDNNISYTYNLNNHTKDLTITSGDSGIGKLEFYNEELEKYLFG